MRKIFILVSLLFLLVGIIACFFSKWIYAMLNFAGSLCFFATALNIK